jgi:hypothetical protein
MSKDSRREEIRKVMRQMSEVIVSFEKREQNPAEFIGPMRSLLTELIRLLEDAQREVLR